MLPRLVNGYGLSGPVAEIAKSLVPENVGPEVYGATGVYSRALGIVFLLGGKDREGNNGGAWMYDMWVHQWTRLGCADELSSVVSASWSGVSRELTVLDNDGKYNRLLTIDPFRGEARVRYEIDSEGGMFETKWLLTAPSGNPVLVCASERGAGVTILEMSLEGGKALPIAVWSGDFQLAAPPIGDRGGFVLSLAPAEEGTPPEMMRIGRLPAQAEEADLLRCMR